MGSWSEILVNMTTIFTRKISKFRKCSSHNESKIIIQLP